MSRSCVLLTLILVACGSPEAPAAPTEAPPGEAPAAESAPPPPDEPAPPPVEPLPDDFHFIAEGSAGEGVPSTQYRLEPGTEAGTFVIIGRTSVLGALGMPSGPPTESAPVTVPLERVQALHAYVVSHREELSAPCVDPAVTDGVTTQFTMTSRGRVEVFRCTNARTPEFSELEAMWTALLTEIPVAP